MKHVLSMHQSRSGRYLTKGVGFSPDAFRDGFVPHWIFARGLQFNPQALDACQTTTIFFDSRTMGQGGSMRRNGQIDCPLCSYRIARPSGSASAAHSGGGGTRELAVQWAEGRGEGNCATKEVARRRWFDNVLVPEEGVEPSRGVNPTGF